MPEGSRRVAVIDIGSNSTRLLVADVDDGRVTPIERRTTVTRLGRGVDLTGRLAAEAIEAACGAVGPYLG
ncbi:MAG: exopolyphosphatase / guanosine-5-triphosphate,3-diphosphate pyrophosphatase, partial [Solirubrobacteraceae bacterium]|nr:exopolyphosphatase / guanosine-5-triphosphate,3-diphosphate pyrophosphatase [Solirubrobacteraceae bacterium]